MNFNRTKHANEMAEKQKDREIAQKKVEAENFRTREELKVKHLQINKKPTTQKK